MIIDINPQTITEIAQTISNTHAEVEKASNILRSITEHNDWNCKERDTINDYTLSNATEILKISEKASNFSNVMKKVAENFRTDEKNVAELFAGVESTLAALLAIEPISGGNSNLPASGAAEIAGSISYAEAGDFDYSSVVNLPDLKM